MAENFCSNCGNPYYKMTSFVAGGKSTVRAAPEAPEAPEAPTTPYYDPRADRKDPFTAALGSLIIVGVGQFYVGKRWRGLGFMALAILFFWATIPMSRLGVIVIWSLAPIDAYDQAKKHNIKYGYSEEAIGEAEHGEEEGLWPQELWVEG